MGRDMMATTTKCNKSTKKGTTTAVVIETDEADNDFVAVVGMSLSIISKGTDSGSDEYLKSPQNICFLIVLSMIWYPC